MGRQYPEIYKDRLKKFRWWFMSYLIDEYPNGCPRSTAIAAGAARFEVSPETVKNWMITIIAGEPDFLQYKQARRLFVKYTVQADVEALLVREARKEAARK